MHMIPKMLAAVFVVAFAPGAKTKLHVRRVQLRSSAGFAFMERRPDDFSRAYLTVESLPARRRPSLVTDKIQYVAPEKRQIDGYRRQNN